jgi:hypothetical protein
MTMCELHVWDDCSINEYLQDWLGGVTIHIVVVSRCLPFFLHTCALSCNGPLAVNPDRRGTKQVP